MLTAQNLQNTMATSTTVSGMVDSVTAPGSPAEQKHHASLAAERVSHITAAGSGYEHECAIDTMHFEAATQENNIISNGNHAGLASPKQKTLDFSADSTDSCGAIQSEVTGGVYVAGYVNELVSDLQEIKEFTNTQPEGHSDFTDMEVEQGLDQEAKLELRQEAEQMLYHEAERGLHPQAELELHQEAELELHQGVDRGLYHKAERGLHPKVELELHQEAERGLYHEAQQGLHHEAERRLFQEADRELLQEAELSEVHDISAATGISETNKPKFDSLAFIGPVLPSGQQQLQSQGVCIDASDAADDIMGSPCDPQRPNVSFADDFRYNLTLGSVPKLAASAGWEFQQVDDNFLRGCKWSPDGSCVLTNSNDNCLRIFNSCNEAGTSELTGTEQMAASVKMKECSLVYDFDWHPKMNLAQADHCRVACTCSGIPIHLWDVTTRQIVANYRAYDQFDEITAAYSLSFSLDGQKIYAGYNKAIRIFDTDYPVRSCKTVKTYNSQRKDGQTGIISSFAFSPDGNGLYVAGSYSRHIGIYDSACDKLVCLMQGQHGGVTHLMFSPDATKLYSGGRKDAEILCWDMRNMDKLLFSALRDVKTNQRMYFDLSQSGRYLVSGNNDGTVAFWDTLSPIEEINGDAFLKPCSQFQAHGDCVNGVSFNHHKNMLATASGQRHFQNFNYDSGDSAEDENIEGADTLDFSLRLWQIPLLS